MARIGFDPSVYNSSVVGSFTPGAVYTNDGKEYVYAKLADTTGTVNAANGNLVCWSSISTTEPSVSLDTSDGDHSDMPAGVAVGTVTNGNYGFFQTRGVHANVTDTGGGVTLNSAVVTDVNNDGAATNVTAASDAFRVFGTALAASSGNTFPCKIQLS